MPDSKQGQNGGRNYSYLGLESCKTLSVSPMKYLVLNLKMIFGKNHEQPMKHLQFKFGTVPPKSAEIYLFAARCLESFELQPICELYLKCGLIFYKNGVVNFFNIFLVDASQKAPFLALGKWKMYFLLNKVENFLRQPCVPSQDAHVCTIQAHSEKLCRGCGHNIGHLPGKP